MPDLRRYRFLIRPTDFAAHKINLNNARARNSESWGNCFDRGAGDGIVIQLHRLKQKRFQTLIRIARRIALRIGERLFNHCRYRLRFFQQLNLSGQTEQRAEKIV